MFGMLPPWLVQLRVRSYSMIRGRRKFILLLIIGVGLLLLLIIPRGKPTTAVSLKPLPPLQDEWLQWPLPLNLAPCKPKIYVYDLPHQLHLKSKQREKCRWSQYNAELFLNTLISSKHSPINQLYVTSNPEEADFFFVPLFSACYLFHCWDSHKWDQSLRCDVDQKYIEPILDYVQHSLPYWNATQGQTHLLIHPMDHVDDYYTSEIRQRMQNATYLVTVGDLRNTTSAIPFRRSQDIVIPSSTHLLHSYYLNPRHFVNAEGHPLSKPLLKAEFHSAEIYRPSTSVTSRSESRKKLAIFRGRYIDVDPTSNYSLGVRSFFNRLSKHSDFDIATTGENADYAIALAHAKFGLAPPGHTLDSTRIWEYLAFGVVPVFIGTEGLVLPFEDDVDWRSFSVFIPRSKAHSVHSILLDKVESGEYESMRKNVWKVGRQAVIESSRGNVWHIIAKQLCRRKGTTLEERSVLEIAMDL